MTAARRVLVAGASGPLGAATVAHLVDRGWSVAAQNRSRPLPATIAGRRDVHEVSCDILGHDGPRRLVMEAEASLGGQLDGVVNCAWPSHPQRRLGAVSEGDLDLALDGLRVHLDLVAAVLPSLRQTRGCLVFLGGALAHRRHPGLGLFSLAKAAAENACLTLALEEGPQGVRVNVVAPGRVDVGGDADLAASDPDFAGLDRIGDLRRALPVPTPAEVARVVGYLLSPAAAALTGQVLAVTGGEQW